MSDNNDLSPGIYSAHYRPSIWLFAHSSMHSLAKKIEELCEKRKSSHVPKIDKGTIERRSVKFKNIIEWVPFDDGFPNLFIEEVKEMAGRDIIFLASFHDPAVIFEQLGVIYALPKYMARSLTVIVPYFPTGTMERVDREGQIATAKTLANMLSSTPLSSRGPTQLLILDIHALQIRFYFGDSTIPRLETGIPLLTRELRKMKMEGQSCGKSYNFAIAFPDDGACKRFRGIFDDNFPLPIIICNKIREKDKKIVTIKEGDGKDADVIIVDDLVQSGGTLIECAKVLKAKGARSIRAYVTHAVFPKKSYEKFIGNRSGIEFDTFWITDTIPHASEIAKNEPFKILSICDVIADTLLGFDMLLA
ncbi:DgyrCDS5001 [Dimorphilus gyrociliatus]|uniref:DgyrCDS5001 n=1 Tax=Dimorphilus gyrociliatus TaxID=2664684 RepID=A0A7I8VIN5_9ANNE|nr:DgyrCDS5001 [Dimorphilus gyrociliatus]